jgi:hypothetical protein
MEHPVQLSHSPAIFLHAVQHMAAIDQVDRAVIEGQTSNVQMLVADSSDSTTSVPHSPLFRPLPKPLTKLSLWCDMQHEPAVPEYVWVFSKKEVRQPVWGFRPTHWTHSLLL